MDPATNPFLQRGAADGGEFEGEFTGPPPPYEASADPASARAAVQTNIDNDTAVNGAEESADGFVLLNNTQPLSEGTGGTALSPTPPPRAQAPLQTGAPALAVVSTPTPPPRGVALTEIPVVNRKTSSNLIASTSSATSTSTNPFAAAAAADAAAQSAQPASIAGAPTAPQQQQRQQQQYYTPADADGTYSLSWGTHYGKRTPVICQNQNGPCPLLALCNVLLLRGAIALRPNQAKTNFEELVHLLSEYLLLRTSVLPEGVCVRIYMYAVCAGMDACVRVCACEYAMILL